MDGSIAYGQVLTEQTVGDLLGQVSARLDITEPQRNKAESAYRSLGETINASTDARLQLAKVFAQGSFATGTVVRPIDDSAEFDVDVICRLVSSREQTSPRNAKEAIGSVLFSDGWYAARTTAKSRCWRVDYAGEFHVDVAPVVPQIVPASGDWIPDRDLNAWIATHPEGYAAWFNDLANSSRSALLLERQVVAKAEIVPFPDAAGDSGWLRRLVQLLKRHRSIWNETQTKANQEFTPISIVITTLAAYAYSQAISRTRFQTPYALMRTILQEMPNHIIETEVEGRRVVVIPSPVAKENFANKWASSPLWEQQFRAWHKVATATLTNALNASGADTLEKVLGGSFGARPSREVIAAYASASKNNSSLAKVSSTGGLVASSSASGMPVRPHTFYGDHDK